MLNDNLQCMLATYQETTDASSVYALACDPEGKLLMYGSPDKVTVCYHALI
jgi:hypothetical protein